MTERLGRMLEEVAGEIRPRETDPVPAITRRVRRHRRRTTAALAAAVAVLVGAGTVVGMQLSGPAGKPPAPATPPLPPPVTTPATPVVDNGTVRAGGFRMPVPNGWTVATTDRAICDTAPNTLFLDSSVLPGGPCTTSPTRVEIRGFSPGGRSGPAGGFDRQVILPGGQPAWLKQWDLDSIGPGPDAEERNVSALLPWAGVRIEISGERRVVRALWASISTEPVAADRIVVPEKKRHFRVSDTREGGDRPADSDAVDTLYRTLAGLTRPVAPDEACAPGSRMGVIYIVDPTGSMPGNTAAVLVVGFDEGCDQVTSSHGGRMWLTPEARSALAPFIVEGRIGR
jgi:hypothetical protein